MKPFAVLPLALLLACTSSSDTESDTDSTPVPSESESMESESESDTGVVSSDTNPFDNNKPPEVPRMDLGTDEDVALDITLEGTDFEGDALTFRILKHPTNGLVTGTPPNIVYTPDPHWSGEDWFSYTADDGQRVGNRARVYITVLPQSDPPIVMDDTINVDEDRTTVVAASDGVLANDMEVDGEAMSVTLVTDVQFGTLTLDANGGFTYVHNAGPERSDSFVYEVSDGEGLTAQGTATLNIVEINDLPVATDDAYTGDEGATLSIDAASGLLANDTDEEGHTLSAVVVGEPMYGELTLNDDGSFDYVHDGSETTADSFTYRAEDAGQSNVATVSLTINPVNDPPMAYPETFISVPAGGTMNVPAPGVLANEVDPDTASLTVTVVTAPAKGTLTLNADGSFDYVHAGAVDHISDSFVYEVSDGEFTATATATIQVVP